MPRGKKDKFDALDDDFKDAVASMKEADIRAQISKVALAQENLLQGKEQDQDLQEKQEAASEAGAQYREGTKMNRLRIAFCKRVLEDQGKSTGSEDDDLEAQTQVSVNGNPVGNLKDVTRRLKSVGT